MEKPTARPHDNHVTGHSGNTLRHRYRKLKQSRRLLNAALLRLLGTLIITGCWVGVCLTYSNMGVLSRLNKYGYNAAVTALSIIMSLNAVNSLKELAAMYRWRLLARTKKGHSPQVVDLILSMMSYQKCLELLWAWRKRPAYSLPLLLWILWGIAIQAAISCLGFTYEHRGDGAFTVKPGEVFVTELGRFWTERNQSRVPQWFEENYQAHLFGDLSDQLVDRKTFADIDERSKDSAESAIYQHPEESLFRYYFADYTYKRGEVLTYRSDRYVNAEANCFWSPIVDDGGSNARRNIAAEIDGVRTVIPWAPKERVTGTTVFMSPSQNQDPDANPGAAEPGDPDGLEPSSPGNNCGSRCSRIEILHLRPTLSASDYYRCNVTVSPVQNAQSRAHLMSDLFARRASSAIGVHSLHQVGSAPGGQEVWYSVNAYSSNATTWGNWENREGEDATKRAETMVAGFAAGAVAMADQRSLKTVATEGMRSTKGVILAVDWNKAAGIWAGLLAAQALLALATVLLAGDVLCKDDSNWTMGRLLRDTLGRIGPTGSASSGGELADALSDLKLKYGSRELQPGTADGGRVLDLVDVREGPQDVAEDIYYE